MGYELRPWLFLVTKRPIVFSVQHEPRPIKTSDDLDHSNRISTAANPSLTISRRLCDIDYERP